MSYRILLMEQDETLANILRYNLRSKGNTVEWCKSDDEVMRTVAVQSFDLIMLDTIGTGLQGLRPLTRLKKKGNRTPTIILCNQSQDEDVVRGLMLGAEDVIRKPFGCGELIARINAILRRINENVMYAVSTTDEIFRLGFVEVFPKRFEVHFHDECITFRKEEFNLIFHFLKHPGTVFSSDQLIEIVYGKSTDPKRVINYIAALRKKIQIAEPYIKIDTINTLGYKLTLNNRIFLN